MAWASTAARSIGPARLHTNGRRWPRCSWTLRCRRGSGLVDMRSAHYVDAAGAEHDIDVTVVGSPPAGETVRAWVDREGRVVEAPLTALSTRSWWAPRPVSGSRHRGAWSSGRPGWVCDGGSTAATLPNGLASGTASNPSGAVGIVDVDRHGWAERAERGSGGARACRCGVARHAGRRGPRPAGEPSRRADHGRGAAAAGRARPERAQPAARPVGVAGAAAPVSPAR